jgi:hypothetical protein
MQAHLGRCQGPTNRAPRLPDAQPGCLDRIRTTEEARYDGRGMGTCRVQLLRGARGRLPGRAVHDHPSHAGSHDRPGVPDLHGTVPSLRRPRLGKAFNYAWSGATSIASIVALVLLFDDPGSTAFVLTAIGLGVWVVGVLVVSNVWKTPTYKLILAGDPEAMPVDWEATRQRYFTINWIQLATTWAAFALFLVALVAL